ncbi:MAG: aspartate 1-decarboxylase [Thermodesulfovibrionales bacterium]|nr:aspartate 1-decarboxylase [Thermodesulfovibrionales bacterium]
MLRFFLRSKIHMAVITEANPNYKGSITIDSELMKLAGLLPYEQVTISNASNGERFETYVIEGEPGSRTICLNGPAARKGMKGDKIIIFAYCALSDNEIEGFKPSIVYVDEMNNPID